ncbi:hypothetical protein ACWEJP_01825 [Streptomyces sp. NPDC004749]
MLTGDASVERRSRSAIDAGTPAVQQVTGASTGMSAVSVTEVLSPEAMRLVDGALVQRQFLDSSRAGSFCLLRRHRSVGDPFRTEHLLGVVVNWPSVGLTDDFFAPCRSVRRIPTHGRLTPCGN